MTVTTPSDQFSAEAALSIGELADELGITTRAIRYYEEKGMISPERTAGQQRFYTRKDRGRLKLLIRAKGLGFNLDDIRQLFLIYDSAPNEEGERLQLQKLQHMITGRLSQIDDQLVQLNEIKTVLQTRLEQVEARL